MKFNITKSIVILYIFSLIFLILGNIYDNFYLLALAISIVSIATYLHFKYPVKTDYLNGDNNGKKI